MQQTQYISTHKVYIWGFRREEKMVINRGSQGNNLHYQRSLHQERPYHVLCNVRGTQYGNKIS
jgi:hypothetical protein